MKGRILRAPLTACGVLLLTGAVAGAADSNSVLVPSVATYSVQYRGINAGTIAFALRNPAPGRFVYESRSNARGIARLVIRNEVHEASTFIVADGRIEPQSYLLDDGSKDTAKDTRLEFDWSAGVARGEHENQPLELKLAPGLQDRMSVQVLVMQQLARGEEPGRLDFIDRDEVKAYQYAKEGTARLTTPVGEVDTVIYSSTREGSSRVSRIWYAPSLGYTPVRAEQARRGKVETVLELVKLER